MNFTGDYEDSLEMQLPACKTDDTAKDKNKFCQFPFKYRGTLHSQCITEGSDDGRAWCATAVNKRRRRLKGKWGNCDPKMCTSLNFDETGFKIHMLDCIKFHVRYKTSTIQRDINIFLCCRSMSKRLP